MVTVLSRKSFDAPLSGIPAFPTILSYLSRQCDVKLEGDRVVDVKFDGVGCAICTASASLMTEKLKGLDEAQVQRLFDRFHAVLTGQPQEESDIEELGKLAALAGVRRFPIRVKCATLPWHTLKAALEGQDLVSTE